MALKRMVGKYDDLPIGIVGYTIPEREYDEPKVCFWLKVEHCPPGWHVDGSSGRPLGDVPYHPQYPEYVFLFYRKHSCTLDTKIDPMYLGPVCWYEEDEE